MGSDYAGARGARDGYLDRIEAGQDALAWEVKGVKRELRALRSEMRAYFAALVVALAMMWASVVVALVLTGA